MPASTAASVPPDERVTLVDVPRPGGRVRRLAVLHPSLDRDYRDAVARVAPLVERALGPEVFAERVADVRTLALRDHRRARRRFRAAVARLTAAEGATAVDVARCYGSMGPGSVERALLRLGAHPAEVGRIVRILDGFARAGVEGLPVGPAASAVLANALLGQVDRALAGAGLGFVRWVDDVVVAAPVDRAVETFAQALGPWGLEANQAKTRELTASSLAAGVGGSVW